MAPVSPEDLAAGARRACEARGMTPDGILALCQELSGGDATTPVVLEPVEDESGFQYLVMPVQVRG